MKVYDIRRTLAVIFHVHLI